MHEMNYPIIPCAPALETAQRKLVVPARQVEHFTHRYAIVEGEKIKNAHLLMTYVAQKKISKIRLS
jgi:hypothetical protein